MKTIAFEIAKKMNKRPLDKNSISLSSFRWDGSSASLILIAPDFAEMKASVHGYKELTGAAIGCRMRGKSMEISSSDLQELLEYAKTISFSGEDVMDVFEYCSGRPDSPWGEIEMTKIELNKDSLSLLARIEVPDEIQPDQLYSQLMPALNHFGMGIIKDHG